MKDPSLIVSIAAIVVSVVGVIVSYVVARKYGDVAALKASRKLHEEDARKARLIPYFCANRSSFYSLWMALCKQRPFLTRFLVLIRPI